MRYTVPTTMSLHRSFVVSFSRCIVRGSNSLWSAVLPAWKSVEQCSLSGRRIRVPADSHSSAFHFEAGYSSGLIFRFPQPRHLNGNILSLSDTSLTSPKQ